MTNVNARRTAIAADLLLLLLLLLLPVLSLPAQPAIERAPAFSDARSRSIATTPAQAPDRSTFRFGAGPEVMMNLYYVENVRTSSLWAGAGVFAEWRLLSSDDAETALALRPRIGGGYAYLFGEITVKASWRDVYALAGAQLVQNWDSLGSDRNIRYTLDGTPAFLLIGLGVQRGDLFAEVRAHFGLNPTILETVYPGELWGLDHTITLEKWRYGAVSVNVGWML